MKKIPDGVFKPKPSTGEKKSDVTNAVALQITGGEKAAREAKTARLRLARLAHEETHPPVAPEKKARTRTRRTSNVSR
jgi:hypothetical protein